MSNPGEQTDAFHLEVCHWKWIQQETNQATGHWRKKNGFFWTYSLTLVSPVYICIRLTYLLMYISSPAQAMWSLLTHLRTWGTSFHVHKELNQRIALPCNVVLGATERFIFNYETILTVGDFDWNLYIILTSLWKFDKCLTNTCFSSHIHQAWNSCSSSGRSEGKI